jgi:pilus assembly protein Flp/PilA
MKKLVNFLKNEEAATAVEYGVMIALIIVVCVGAITVFGSNANNTTGDAAPKIKVSSSAAR